MEYRAENLKDLFVLEYTLAVLWLLKLKHYAKGGFYNLMLSLLCYWRAELRLGHKRLGRTFTTLATSLDRNLVMY